MERFRFWLTVLLGLFALAMAVVVARKRWRLRRGRSREQEAGSREQEAASGEQPEPAPPAAAEPGRTATSEQPLQLFGTWTAALAAQLPIPQNTLAELNKELRQAGYYRPTALTEFNALRFVLVAASLFLAGLLCVLLPRSATLPTLAGGSLAATVAFTLPRVVVQAQGRRRVRQIVHGLPDAIDLINMGVSRGLTFPAALRRVQTQIREVHPELSRELEIVQHHADIGSLDQALRQLDLRLDSPEIRTFASTLTQTERLGTGLAPALAKLAASVRTGFRQQAEQAASSAPFKLLFPIVLCLVPAVFLILLGPAAVELADFIRNNQGILNLDQLNIPALTQPTP